MPIVLPWETSTHGCINGGRIGTCLGLKTWHQVSGCSLCVSSFGAFWPWLMRFQLLCAARNWMNEMVRLQSWKLSRIRFYHGGLPVRLCGLRWASVAHCLMPAPTCLQSFQMGFLRICCLIPCMSCVSQFWHAWVFRTFAGLQMFIARFHFHHLGPGTFPGTSSCLSQRMKFDSGLVFRFGFPGYVSVRTAATRTSGWNLANSWFLVWPVLLCFVCASGFMLFHSGSDQCFHIPIFNWPGASAAADVSGIHVGCSTPRGDVYR